VGRKPPRTAEQGRRRLETASTGAIGTAKAQHGVSASPSSVPARARRRLRRANTRGFLPGALRSNADLGLALSTASTALHCAGLDLLTGDPRTGEEELRRAYEAFARSEERYLLPLIAELLAQVVDAQGRFQEAEEIRRAAEWLAASAAEPQTLWPSGGRVALDWREQADEAEWRARESLDLVRIGAALARLSSWYARSASGDSDPWTPDRRAGHVRRAVPAPGLTREGFLREILANEQLPDGDARQLALEMLDVPEERLRKTVVSRNGELGYALAADLSTASPQGSRSPSSWRA
jgi:hypothetical protein